MIVILARLAILATFLAAWQLLSPAFDLEFFLSTPAQVAVSFWAIASNGSLFYHAGITSFEAISGFLLGGALGMAVGLAFGRYPFLAEVMDPFVTTFYSLPKVALAPLFILWFGIGIDMKVILAASIVFFLVFLNTYTGVRQVSREQLAIMRLMGATERQLVFTVIVPSAISWVFAGLRLSVPYALVGAIVAEIIASNRGLGYLLSGATTQFDTAGTFAAIIAIMILAIVLNFLVKHLEIWLTPWRQSAPDREITV